MSNPDESHSLGVPLALQPAPVGLEEKNTLFDEGQMQDLDLDPASKTVPLPDYATLTFEIKVSRPHGLWKLMLIN
jgi:hypothetical protein